VVSRFPEIGAAKERDQEFAECAAENHDGAAEPAEEKVAAFVNDDFRVATAGCHVKFPFARHVSS
jgi:hypothetical protein